MAAKHSFTSAQVAEYTESFKEVDTDGSNSIEASELDALLRKCSIETSPTQAADMVRDNSSNGRSMDLNDFLGLMWKLQSGPSEKEIKADIFTVRVFGGALARWGGVFRR